MIDNIEFTGIDDGLLDQLMQDLDPQTFAKLLRDTNRASIKQYLINPLKSSLPYSAESLKGIQVKNNKAKNKTGVIGGLFKGYALFPEAGTKERYKRGKIVSRGNVDKAIKNSIAPIAKNTFDKAEEKFSDLLDRYIKKQDSKNRKLR